MTREAPYRITTAPTRAKRSIGGTWRGILAVLVLLITAADALGTALVGIPPIAWLWHRMTEVIRDTYRRAGRPAPELVIARIVPGIPSESDNTDG